jgi:hypothetical protein
MRTSLPALASAKALPNLETFFEKDSDTDSLHGVPVENIENYFSFEFFRTLLELVSKASYSAQETRRRSWAALRIAMSEFLETIPFLVLSRDVSVILRLQRQKALVRSFRLNCTLCLFACRTASNLMREEILAESLIKNAAFMSLDLDEEEWVYLLAYDADRNTDSARLALGARQPSLGVKSGSEPPSPGNPDDMWQPTRSS